MSYSPITLKSVRVTSVPTSWDPSTLYYVQLGNIAQTDPTAIDYPRIEIYITDGAGVPTALTNTSVIDGRVTNYKNLRDYDPMSLTFFQRIVDAGGILSENHMIAINTVVKFLRSNAAGEAVTYLSKCAEFYPMAGNFSGSIALGLTNTYNGGIVDMHREKGGYQNAGTGFFNTGITPNLATADGDFASSLDCLSDFADPSTDLGVNSGGAGDDNHQWIMRLKWSDTNYYGDGYTLAGRVTVTSHGTGKAVFTQSHISGQLKVAKDAVIIGTHADTGGGLPEKVVIIGALHYWATSSPAITQYTNRKYRSAAIWKKGLTEAQMLAVNAAMLTYRDLMGEDPETLGAIVWQDTFDAPDNTFLGGRTPSSGGPFVWTAVYGSYVIVAGGITNYTYSGYASAVVVGTYRNMDITLELGYQSPGNALGVVWGYVLACWQDDNNNFLVNIETGQVTKKVAGVSTTLFAGVTSGNTVQGDVMRLIVKDTRLYYLRNGLLLVALDISATEITGTGAGYLHQPYAYSYNQSITVRKA